MALTFQTASIQIYPQLNQPNSLNLRRKTIGYEFEILNSDWVGLVLLNSNPAQPDLCSPPLVKKRSLFSNHTLSNQIQLSGDMFFKKIQFMWTFLLTNKKILMELSHIKFSTILQKNSPLVSKKNLKHVQYYLIE